MLNTDNHIIRYLQGCQVLSWLSGLGSPIFKIITMKLLPLKPCQSCWETFEPHGKHQYFCSEECAKKESGKRGRLRREKSLIDGSGGAYLKLRFTILRRDNFTCQYCGRNAQDGAVLHIDHIQPKTKGGKLVIDNLITSCLECNLGKRDILLSKREQEKLKSKIGVL